MEKESAREEVDPFPQVPDEAAAWGKPGAKVAVARLDGGEEFIRRFESAKAAKHWVMRRRTRGGLYELYEWAAGGRRLVLVKRGAFNVRDEEMMERRRAKLRRRHAREKTRKSMEEGRGKMRKVGKDGRRRTARW